MSGKFFRTCCYFPWKLAPVGVKNTVEDATCAELSTVEDATCPEINTVEDATCPEINAVEDATSPEISTVEDATCPGDNEGPRAGEVTTCSGEISFIYRTCGDFNGELCGQVITRPVILPMMFHDRLNIYHASCNFHGKFSGRYSDKHAWTFILTVDVAIISPWMLVLSFVLVSFLVLSAMFQADNYARLHIF